MWIITTLLCHIVFYFALNKKYVKLLDFLHIFVFVLLSLSIFMNNFGYGKEINVYVICICIILSFQIGNSFPIKEEEVEIIKNNI